MRESDPLHEYIKIAIPAVKERISTWRSTSPDRDVYEVVGGLLARQVTLVLELASTPQIWNHHISPIILRSIIDGYIVLKWILIDAKPRSLWFIADSVRQVERRLEEAREILQNKALNNEESLLLSAYENWINFYKSRTVNAVDQRLRIKDMAFEVGEEGLYVGPFRTMSSVVHPSWYHISMYNLEPDLPAVGVHCREPFIPESRGNYQFKLAADYLDQTFLAFDKAFDLDFKPIYPGSFLTYLGELNDDHPGIRLSS